MSAGVRHITTIDHEDALSRDVLAAMRAHDRSWLGFPIVALAGDVCRRLGMGDTHAVSDRLRALETAGLVALTEQENGITGYIITDKGRAA